MNYEQMLDYAYKNVKVSAVSERFEIPKVKGNHEGNKTIITNFLQIASYIRRDISHFLKFLSKVLASQADISGERLILHRKLTSKEINEKIQMYANEFVLCKKCKKPDTELIEEKNKLYIKCLACGIKTEVHII